MERNPDRPEGKPVYEGSSPSANKLHELSAGPIPETIRTEFQLDRLWTEFDRVWINCSDLISIRSALSFGAPTLSPTSFPRLPGVSSCRVLLPHLYSSRDRSNSSGFSGMGATITLVQLFYPQVRLLFVAGHLALKSLIWCEACRNLLKRQRVS